MNKFAKWLAGVCVVAAMVAPMSASAVTYIAWEATYGMSAAFLSAGGQQTALIQLIWTGLDNEADAASDTGTYVSDDDVVLDSFVITYNDWTYADYGYFTTAYPEPDAIYGPTADLGGYVYGRIFEDDTPDAGDDVFTAELNAVSVVPGPPDPLGTPQAYDLNGGAFASGGTFNGTVVPEPGTWALFALGAVVVGLHRRRRK